MLDSYYIISFNFLGKSQVIFSKFGRGFPTAHCACCLPGFRLRVAHENQKGGRTMQRISGWWLTYPSEKYENQLGLFHISGKIENVPDHQPDLLRGYNDMYLPT